MKNHSRHRSTNAALYRASDLKGSTPLVTYSKPQRAPNIQILNVADCPQCGAEIGARCVNENGAEVGSHHRSRRVKAIRLYNEQRAKEKELQLPEDSNDDGV